MKREGEPCVKKRKDDPNEINKTEDSLSGLQSRIDLLRCLKHLSARQDLKGSK